MKNTKASYILIAVMLAVILNSCGSPGLNAPGELTALSPDSENPNRIEINWKAVDDADIYYVYRSTMENGTYSSEGFSVSSEEVELSSGDTELRYNFIDAFDEGDGGTYWYGIKAASNSDITVESAMSAVVSASTYSGTWGAAKDLGTAAQLKLTADTTNLWAVYSLGAGADAINVQKYAVDEASEADAPPSVWSSITTSMITDGNVNNPFSIFINGGELYTTFRDNGQTDKVSMQYYHDSGTADVPSLAWEAIGAAGFNGAAATEISAVTIGFAGEPYTAYVNSSDEIELYQFTSDAWFDKNLVVDTLIDDTSFLELISHNNSLYIGYEHEASTPISEDGLYLRAWDGSVLQVGGKLTNSLIDDGNAVFVSGGGNLYAVYITDIDGIANNGDGTLIVQKYEEGSWTQVATAGKVEADGSAYGAIDALWFNNHLYVFYINSGDGDKGWVKFYDETDGWQNAQRNGGSAITGGGGITKVQLASAGNTLYAGYIKDGKAYVRILK